jgi:hypothetical protein
VGELSQFIINVFLCFSFMFFILIRQSGGTPVFQLYNVPLSLETQYIIEIINKKLGQVHSYRETIKTKRSNNGPNNPQCYRTPNRNQQPTFKQITVIFKNDTIINNIYRDNIWIL